MNADWSVATTYLSDLGIDSKLRQTSSTTGVSYYLTDHLGSTAGLTDVSGSIVEQLTYDSFGDSAGSAGCLEKWDRLSSPVLHMRKDRQEKKGTDSTVCPTK